MKYNTIFMYDTYKYMYTMISTTMQNFSDNEV